MCPRHSAGWWCCSCLAGVGGGRPGVCVYKGECWGMCVRDSPGVCVCKGQSWGMCVRDSVGVCVSGSWCLLSPRAAAFWQWLLPAEGQESQLEPCRASRWPRWLGHEVLCCSRALTSQSSSLALLCRWSPSLAASSDCCGCKRSSFSWLIQWRANHGGRR